MEAVCCSLLVVNRIRGFSILPIIHLHDSPFSNENLGIECRSRVEEVSFFLLLPEKNPPPPPSILPPRRCHIILLPSSSSSSLLSVPCCSTLRETQKESRQFSN
ncbi:hypothetical protein CSUI_000546 [Cystoisospora suis]|uniref:Uncharacterized protein n=1 Tax=Cystoisospora suis TaxID=483139 RepID=A0A2C6LFS7_9APIC|nr:hypothetical protein CSUI_000546 [Cystoisospora suis]